MKLMLAHLRRIGSTDSGVTRGVVSQLLEDRRYGRTPGRSSNRRHQPGGYTRQHGTDQVGVEHIK